MSDIDEGERPGEENKPMGCASFRAGDHVKHAPSGETWVLAIDQQDGQVSWAGWPEGMAQASDCTLVKAATDEERLDMLKDWAAIEGAGRGPDHRVRAAQQTLLKMGQTPPAIVCSKCGEQFDEGHRRDVHQRVCEG